jgi:hypothetical protein
MMQNAMGMMPGYPHAPLSEGIVGPHPMMPSPEWKLNNGQLMGNEGLPQAMGMMGVTPMMNNMTTAGNGAAGPSVIMSQMRKLAAQNAMMMGLNAASGGRCGAPPHSIMSSQHQNHMILYMQLMQQQQQQQQQHARMQAHQQQQLLLQQQQQQQYLAGAAPPSTSSQCSPAGEDSSVYQNHMHHASLARKEIVPEPNKYRPGTFMESDLVHMHVSASTDAHHHRHNEDGLPEILRHLTMSPSHTDLSNTSTVLPHSAPISEASFSSITVSKHYPCIRHIRLLLFDAYTYMASV